MTRTSLGLLVLALLGLLVRLTIRDRLPGPDLVFYALPPPLLAGLLVASGLLWLGRRSARRRPALFVAAATLAVLWTVGNHIDFPCQRARNGLRILLWNVGWGLGGWDPIASRIRDVDADIIGLVEARTGGPWPEEFWKKRFPAYGVSAPGGGLVVLARGEVRAAHFHAFGRRSRVAVVDLKIDRRSLRVVLVDLEANPLVRRKPLLEEVERVVRARPPAPTVLMGDFNTPGDSVWFGAIRRLYINVAETAGAGLRPTWPYPFPVLTLDHIWISRDLIPRCARKQASRLSDHATVWGEVSWGDRKP